jgi:hypothetical protein
MLIELEFAAFLFGNRFFRWFFASCFAVGLAGVFFIFVAQHYLAAYQADMLAYGKPHGTQEHRKAKPQTNRSFQQGFHFYKYTVFPVIYFTAGLVIGLRYKGSFGRKESVTDFGVYFTEFRGAFNS